MLPFDSLEELLTSEMGFGLTKATNPQRAICWVLQGQPIPALLWEDPKVRECFGDQAPRTDVNLLLFLCAIRSAKTLICVAATVWMAFHVDLSEGAGLDLRHGETPRISYVSRKLELAQEAFNYLSGAFRSSPFLSGFVVGKIGADSLTIQHPSGTPITIRVAALSAFGSNLISRWCAGIIFDEAPRMASGDEGYVLNLKDQIQAVIGRLLKGAWIMIVGSPVGGVGFVYDLFQECWQKPHPRAVVMKSPGFMMNPSWWTPERCRALQDADPDAYESDVLANFRDVQASLFSLETLKRCTREDRLVIPRDANKKYTAVMDPATRGNAWAFAISESPDNRMHTICLVREWRGSKAEPLSPKATLKEIKELCDAYGIETVKGDQAAADFIRDIAADIGLGFSQMTFTQQNKTKLYMSVVSRADTGLLSIPGDPDLRRDLLNIKKVYRARDSGNVHIQLPVTPDGRHCDYGPVLAILCGDYVEASDEKPLDQPRAKTIQEMNEEELDALEDRLARADWLYDDEPSGAVETWS